MPPDFSEDDVIGGAVHAAGELVPNFAAARQIPLYSRVRLLAARPGEGLAAGAERSVVYVYPGGGLYEIEFPGEDAGTTVATFARAVLEEIRSG